MKISIFSHLFALFAFLFLTILPVSAQNADEFVGLRFVCLNQARCNGDNDCSAKNDHRTELTTRADVKGIANDPNTYLTECLEIDVNGVPKTVCTTGNSDLDRELFCTPENASSDQCDHLKILKD